MATRGWRPLALASLVTATLAGAVVLRAVFAGDGDGDSARPAPGERPPTPTTSIAGTSTAEPILTLVEPVLEKRTFARGEQVTVSNGIGFLSAETGALETWSKPGAARGEYYGPQASADGTLLFSIASSPDRHIIERATGKTWRLAASVSPVFEASHGLLVPALILEDDTDSLVLLDLATGSVTPLEFAAKRPATIAVSASPDGRKLAVLHGNALSLMELPAGNTANLAEGLPSEGTRLSALPGGLGFTLELPGAQTRRWFSWDGVELERELPLGAVSPNGRYFAAKSSPGVIDAQQVGGYPSLASVVVTERPTGRGVIQALGSDELQAAHLAWTAASDSIVVQVLEGYRVVSLSGQAGPVIPDEIHVLEPRPSPTIGGLLGTNRGTIINTSRGETIAPLYAEFPWRASWTTRPGELAVELSTLGKGRDWPLEVLPFELRTTVSLPPTRVTITSNSCTNMREGPEASAAIVQCLQPGTTASIEPVEENVTDLKSNEVQSKRYVGKEASDLTVWIHLRLASGEGGWMDSKTLGWGK